MTSKISLGFLGDLIYNDHAGVAQPYERGGLYEQFFECFPINFKMPL